MTYIFGEYFGHLMCLAAFLPPTVGVCWALWKAWDRIEEEEGECDD